MEHIIWKELIEFSNRSLNTRKIPQHLDSYNTRILEEYQNISIQLNRQVISMSAIVKKSGALNVFNKQRLTFCFL